MFNFKNISTLGPLGYFVAPGTWGSIVGLICGYFLNYYFTSYNFLIVIISSVISLIIINKSYKEFNSDDPQEINLDEFVGMQFALLSLKLTFLNYLIAFTIFRILDITKILGIKYSERLPGAWAIIVDDILAGIITNIFINLIIYFA